MQCRQDMWKIGKYLYVISAQIKLQVCGLWRHLLAKSGCERPADDSKATGVDEGFIPQAEHYQKKVGDERHPKRKQHIRDKSG